MKLQAAIAWRYLWKKKSHGAVSAIAVVSVVGVAVATAAIICVLSVFNGFRELIVERNDLILPDVEITPRQGKVISDGDCLADCIAAIKGVEISTPMLTDQALAIYDSHEMPVMLRGVDPAVFRKLTRVDSLLYDGEMLPEDAMAAEPPYGMPTIGVAYKLHGYAPGERYFLFAPRREGRINPANPLTSFFTDSITVAGILETGQSEIDLNSVYVPIELARGLFQYDSEATSVAVKALPGVDSRELAKDISAAIGDGYEVKDRGRQQEISFRMVEIEKWVTALLLLFILVIASFNIISTLTMFVLEKRRSINTFRALGMNRSGIGAIFGWESMYVTLIGVFAGILPGVCLCLLQEHYGFIRMNGDETTMRVLEYPVVLEYSDIWIVMVPLLIIGAITSWIAASFARSRISETRQ